MSRIRIRIEVSILVCLATALIVTGCRKQPEQPPAREQPIEQPRPATPPPPKPAEPSTPPPPKIKPAPPPPVAADQQMLDDADAAGMTARVQPDADSEAAPDADTNRQQ